MSFGYQYDPYDSGWGGSAQPGAVALRDTLLPLFRDCYDLGILRDRSRCRQKRSAHCHGRAWDAGFPGASHPEGTRLALWCVEHAQALGIQRVIWGFPQGYIPPGPREWDSRPGERTWERYSGHPHTDHVHIELCWEAARTLTASHIRAVYEGESEEDEMLIVGAKGHSHLYLTDGVHKVWIDPTTFYELADKGVKVAGDCGKAFIDRLEPQGTQPKT